MKRLLISTLFLALIATAARPQKLIDQILVIINDDVITRTDLLWSLALDPDSPSPAQGAGQDALRQMLEVLTEQRLVYQEAARIPSSEITQDEINRKRNELIRRFGSEGAFRQRVESVGLTSARIDELMRQRILIERFVEFRFRSFVFVSETQVQKYYDEQLVPQVRAAGQVPPPIEQVRENILELLKAAKYEEELDRWLKEARQRNEIVQIADP
jgi:hypothetical protein